MEQSIKKFLEFSGADGESRNIYFLTKDGQYWIALKPICDALQIDWRNQHKSISRDKTLGAASSVQTMQLDEKQSRDYLCLPEFYVYGWLFQVKSDSPQLKEYKWKCYELLYNYFHGTIAKRISTLTQKSADQIELALLQRTIEESEEGQRIEELKKRMSGHARSLRQLDVALSESQISIFN